MTYNIAGGKIYNQEALEMMLDGLEEKIDLRPPQEQFDYRPQPKQMELLDACGLGKWWRGEGEKERPVCRLIGFGGSKYGAKSYGMMGLAGVWALAYPGSQISMFRRTYAQMEGAGALLNKSYDIFGRIAEPRENGKIWKWPNGSALYFQHCQDDNDRYNYQGKQIDLLLVDQAEQFTWVIIDYLLMQNRVSGEHGIYSPVTVLSANPGGIGNIWYYRTFGLENKMIRWLSGAKLPQERVNENGKKIMVYFIPSYVKDNVIGMKLDPEYPERLKQSDPGMAAAMLEGDFEKFGGMAFPMWDIERHVCEPFDIPASWPKWRAIDWGYDAPLVCGWLAKNPVNGRKYVYREYASTGLTDREAARTIVTYSPANEGVTITYGDPKSFSVAKNVDGIIKTAQQEYMENGVPITLADNNRINGKKKVTNALGDLEDGKPGLIFFSHCKKCIETIPMLKKDERNPEDVDSKGDDHCYDMLRYALTNEDIHTRVRSEEEKARVAANNPMKSVPGI